MSHDPSAERPLDADIHCARVQRLLWDLVDGALPLGREQAMRRHLERCDACRSAWEACLQAERALASAASSAPPPTDDLRAGFYARLAAQPVPARSGLLTLTLTRAVLPVLAACLLLGIFFKAQFVALSKPPGVPPLKFGLTGGTQADFTSLRPEDQAKINHYLAQADAPSNRAVASVRPPQRRRGTGLARFVRLTVRNRPHSYLPAGRIARVTAEVKRGGSTRPLDRRLTASTMTARRAQVPAPATALPTDSENGTASASPGTDYKATPASGVVTAGLAATSGEQEVYVVDEERGFTRSARVIAADVHDDAPIISVEADSTQN